jgi:hypothetical protein
VSALRRGDIVKLTPKGPLGVVVFLPRAGEDKFGEVVPKAMVRWSVGLFGEHRRDDLIVVAP